MKKIFHVILLFSASYVFGQVAIGKSTVTNPSVSLEFGNIAGDANTQRGILLPWVNSVASVSNVVEGTLVFDTIDKKVKYYSGAASPLIPFWFDLSSDSSGIVNTSLQDALQENDTAKVSIGDETNTAGVLVLEDNNKAMILPLVDKYSSVVNPSPGMMVYDLANNMLCVFNGKVWTFWTEN